jgi:hypothetical protein
VNSIASIATEVKQLLLLGDVSTRHALADRRASAVDRVTRENSMLIDQIYAESAQALEILNQCLWNHCEILSTTMPIVSEQPLHGVNSSEINPYPTGERMEETLQ